MNFRDLKSKKGQVVVEYVLLIVVSVGMAILISRLAVSRSDSDPGFLVEKWHEIIEAIGSDYADEF